MNAKIARVGVLAIVTWSCAGDGTGLDEYDTAGSQMSAKFGHFTIDDISLGTYAVRAWHPYLGMQEQEMTLLAKETSEIAFQFSSN